MFRRELVPYHRLLIILYFYYYYFEILISSKKMCAVCLLLSFQVKTADNRVIQEQLTQKVCIRTVSTHSQKDNLNQTNSF